MPVDRSGDCAARGIFFSVVDRAAPDGCLPYPNIFEIK
ncbi:hypothetical protein PORCRE_1405 [Porphyromonas crevioricanis JCM 15906]|uniref:Uncharacterized protein n=1 Tax=Porphyromonas crevioricanis JCM 15906 TaxID=1305617 RepID=T1DTA8_9PORP|nr:hypothetical protein PORCRE_1405 [Porphyromonas crevioricanis JCM 15906]GAD06586.1 hypothetical protein PORCAN_183 [Porphyromonas crevioricanis JCM 13913]